MSLSIQMRESQFKQCFHSDIRNWISLGLVPAHWVTNIHQHSECNFSITLCKDPYPYMHVRLQWTMIRNQRRMSMSSCNTKTNVFSFVYYNIYLLTVSQPTLTWGPRQLPSMYLETCSLTYLNQSSRKVIKYLKSCLS